MNGYTKLFGSIVASTIWREDDKTRIVWVTMLAMANKHGDVEASIPGLSDLARVSIADVEKALKTLQEPDSYSRTKDFEGRRIASIDGGWHILNHGKYREKMSKDERREYLRKKQAERRARLKEESERVNKSSTNVAKCQLPSNSVNVEGDIAEADSDSEESDGPPPPPGWPSPEEVLKYAKSNSIGVLRTDIIAKWQEDRKIYGYRRPGQQGNTYEIVDWRGDLQRYHRIFLENERRDKAEGKSKKPLADPDGWTHTR